MLRKLGAQLEGANAKVAEATKAWRDERLTSREADAREREREITAREIDVASQLAEIRRLESRRRRRKFFYVSAFCIGAILGFFAGFGAGLSTEEEPTNGSQAETTAIGSPSEIVESPLMEPAPESSAELSSSLSECVVRGVDYFKEIGSYPTLHSAPDTGRLAEDVAFERCQRSLKAFDPW